MSAVVLSTQAQDTGTTNTVSRSQSDRYSGSKTNRAEFGRDKRWSGSRHEKMDESAKHERRLQLMERELKRIGVTEEEKAQILALQKSYKEKMEVNTLRVTTAREKLSKLMNEGAPMDVLESTIQEISEAQADQLRTLVRNRIEMERILGKKKHDEFMKNARMQYQKHGRRGGPPLPPRPGQPPAPEQQEVPATPAPPEAPGN